jgi:hypothetical protein
VLVRVVVGVVRLEVIWHVELIARFAPCVSPSGAVCKREEEVVGIWLQTCAGVALTKNDAPTFLGDGLVRSIL